MIHPTVQTSPVENVLTVRQAPDFFLFFELVQTHGAALRRVTGACVGRKVTEFDDREEFPDQESGNGRVIGDPDLGIGPDDLRIEEIGDAEEMEEQENEVSDESENGKCVDEDVGEENLGVAHWETHGGSRERKKERRREMN